MNLAGKERGVFSQAGGLFVHDVAPDGRVLPEPRGDARRPARAGPRADPAGRPLVAHVELPPRLARADGGRSSSRRKRGDPGGPRPLPRGPRPAATRPPWARATGSAPSLRTGHSRLCGRRSRRRTSVLIPWARGRSARAPGRQGSARSSPLASSRTAGASPSSARKATRKIACGVQGLDGGAPKPLTPEGVTGLPTRPFLSRTGRSFLAARGEGWLGDLRSEERERSAASRPRARRGRTSWPNGRPDGRFYVLKPPEASRWTSRSSTP